MRTTINLDEHLLREAKQLAAAKGQTLSEVIEEALRAKLAQRHALQARERVSLPSFKGQGVRPGIDLKDWASVLDAMEQADGAP